MDINMRLNVNMTVKDLKEVLEQILDDRPVIIPCIEEYDSNHILGFRYVRTAGLLKDELNPDSSDNVVLCLNTAADGLDISSQLEASGKSVYISCERVLFGANGEKMNESPRYSGRYPWNIESKKCWYSIALGKEEVEPFKQYLREQNIEFEPSEKYGYIHMECYMTSDEAEMANAFLKRS